MQNGCVQALTWTLISVYWQWRISAPKLYKKEERLTLHEHSSSFGGVLVAHLFSFFCGVLLYVFTFRVLSCDAHYDFCITQCSVHIYLQVFVGGPMSYLRYVCLLRIVVSNTYLVVCMFRLSSSCVPYVVIFSGLSILDSSFGIHFL